MFPKRRIFGCFKGTFFWFWVLGIGKTPPPHVGKNSQIIPYFFLSASLIHSYPIGYPHDDRGQYVGDDSDDDGDMLCFDMECGAASWRSWVTQLALLIKDYPPLHCNPLK